MPEGLTQAQTRRLIAVAAGGLGALLLAGAARRSRGIDFRDRVIIITGGSRGLGLVLARMLAGEGARLTLVARDRDELERARQDVARHGAPVVIVQADIGNRLAAPRIVDATLNAFGRIDVLVNNAGVMQVGPLDHMTHEDYDEAMRAHFWGPLQLMLAVIPHMRHRGGGRIVNIASIGGKVAVPHMAPYTASKFALVGLSDAFRAEVARDGIRVTTVCPAPMRTGSPINAAFKGRRAGEFSWFALSASVPVLSIDDRRAARKIIEACRHGTPELVITPHARLAVLASAAAPGLVALAMATANRLLPAPTGPEGARARPGKASRPRWVPRVVTRMSDRAAERNNEGG